LPSMTMGVDEKVAICRVLNAYKTSGCEQNKSRLANRPMDCKVKSNESQDNLADSHLEGVERLQRLRPSGLHGLRTLSHDCTVLFGILRELRSNCYLSYLFTLFHSMT
jgi:hypothetical protein